MTQPNSQHTEVLRAAFQCSECQWTRAYGDHVDALYASEYRPLLECINCRRQTRHKYVGLQHFGVEFVRSPQSESSRQAMVTNWRSNPPATESHP